MSQPLTKQEVADLPEGVDVVVTWSGGNGPHRYKTKRHYGSVFAVTDDGFFVGTLDFIGDKAPFTVVKRATNG